jgi:hypothetical protein
LGEETYKRRYYSNGFEKISFELDWWIWASVKGYCERAVHDVNYYR